VEHLTRSLAENRKPITAGLADETAGKEAFPNSSGTNDDQIPMIGNPSTGGQEYMSDSDLSFAASRKRFRSIRPPIPDNPAPDSGKFRKSGRIKSESVAGFRRNTHLGMGSVFLCSAARTLLVSTSNKILYEFSGLKKWRTKEFRRSGDSENDE